MLVVYCASSRAWKIEIPVMRPGGAVMKNNRVIKITLAIVALLISRPVFAHHSGAAFDMDHMVTLKGTVTNFEWSNPHVFIYLDVKDDKGNVEPWRIEANSPNMLTRVGWNREMIKPGIQRT